MPERTGVVTLAGNPVTLLGNAVQVGDPAPNFTVVDNNLTPVSLDDYRGNTLIISAVPSLDTPVCDMQTRFFNQEAGTLDESVRILTISMDLPFAQKRWCGAAGVEHVITLSDHRDASFGMAYGVLIADLRLLARAVFVVDAQGIIRYTQLVPEITNEPNYDDVLAAVRRLF